MCEELKIIEEEEPISIKKETESQLFKKITKVIINNTNLNHIKVLSTASEYYKIIKIS